MVDVLLVEDDAGAARLIARMLGKEYAITVCVDSAEAAAAMKAGSHDVWLLDYYLPGTDGLTLLAEARAEGRQTAAILLTGATEASIDRRAIELGAAARLDKDGLTRERLVRAIGFAVSIARRLGASIARRDRYPEPAAVALRRLQRLGQAERELREALAHDVVELDRPLFFGRMLHAGLNLGGCETGVIATVGSDDAGALLIEAALGLGCRLGGEVGAAIELDADSRMARAIATGRPLRVGAGTSARAIGLDGLGAGAACILPVHIADRVAGLVVLGNRPDAFSEDDLEALEPYVEMCGGGLARHEADARRRTAEAARRRAEVRLRALVERSNDLLALLDAEGRVRYQSPSLQALLGCPASALDGQPLHRWLHPDDAALFRDLLADLCAGTELDHSVEVRCQSSDATWRTLAVRLRNALDDPLVDGIILNAHDITEQRRLWAQFLQAQKTESLGRLAAGVAHDFGNLLTVMSACTAELDALLRPMGLGQGDLDALNGSCDAAARLTRQLLLFARAERADVGLVSIADIIERGETIWRSLLPASARLVVEVQPAPHLVRADAAQVEQVLLNLVVNARDAITHAGHIRVSAHTEETPEVSFVVIAVTDDGAGMSEAVQRQAFDPFFTTKAEGKGSGLGLATVHGVVQRHGGRVHVDSAVGEGTRFEVWLPACPSRGVIRSPALSDGPPAG